MGWGAAWAGTGDWVGGQRPGHWLGHAGREAFRYLAMALLLIATRWLPGWGSLLMFLPMGGLAQASDLAQVRGLFHLGDEPLRWQTLARSGAIGGLLGSLAMGLMAQLLGLTVALPVQIGLFAARPWCCQPRTL